MLEIAEIWRYPIKSVGGEQLPNAWVSPLGIEGDREFGLLDPASNRLISRKNAGKLGLQLSLLTARLPEDSVLSVEDTSGGEAVSAEIRRGTSDTDPFNIFDDTMQGVRQDPQFDIFFSDLLNKEVMLVGLTDSHVRRVDQDLDVESRFTSFSDGATVSLHTLASQQAVAEALLKYKGLVLTNDQFRSNLVIDGANSPFDEDYWEHIAIGYAQFAVRKAMMRCNMTEQFQDLASEETLVAQYPRSTLRILRDILGHHGSNRPGSKKDKVLFAQNVTVEMTGNIAVGDWVHVQNRRFEPNWQPTVR